MLRVREMLKVTAINTFIILYFAFVLVVLSFRHDSLQAVFHIGELSLGTYFPAPLHATKGNMLKNVTYRSL